MDSAYGRSKSFHVQRGSEVREEQNNVVEPMCVTMLGHRFEPDPTAAWGPIRGAL